MVYLCSSGITIRITFFQQGDFDMGISRLKGIITLIFFLGSVSCGGGGGDAPHFPLSGTVTLDGVGLAGITMTLFDRCISIGGPLAGECTPHIEATTTTDSNGNYHFEAGAAFYYLTPSKAGFSFHPESLSIALFSEGVMTYLPGQPQLVSSVDFTASKI